MLQSGNHGEIIAMLFEDFQVRRERIIFARIFRKEILRMQPQRRADADHAAARCGPALWFFVSEDVEPREGEGDAGGAEGKCGGGGA